MVELCHFQSKLAQLATGYMSTRETDKLAWWWCWAGLVQCILNELLQRDLLNPNECTTDNFYFDKSLLGCMSKYHEKFLYYNIILVTGQPFIQMKLQKHWYKMKLCLNLQAHIAGNNDDIIYKKYPRCLNSGVILILSRISCWALIRSFHVVYCVLSVFRYGRIVRQPCTFKYKIQFRVARLNFSFYVGAFRPTHKVSDHARLGIKAIVLLVTIIYLPLHVCYTTNVKARVAD